LIVFHYNQGEIVGEDAIHAQPRCASRLAHIPAADGYRYVGGPLRDKEVKAYSTAAWTTAAAVSATNPGVDEPPKPKALTSHTASRLVGAVTKYAIKKLAEYAPGETHA
jgi:hypothetical protein